MLNKYCNGNPISTFPPYYGFHTLTKLFNRPVVAGAVLQTPQKDCLLIQFCRVDYRALQCSAVQYSPVQYSTVQYTIVQCSKL